MFIIQKDIWGYKTNLTGYSCEDQTGLPQLETDCKELNDMESGFVKYKIIELKDQFLCACCNTIYYDKYRNKEDCDCGALRCEFCEDLNNCVCDDNEDDDLELQELNFEDE
jgi:hypothetical protein